MYKINAMSKSISISKPGISFSSVYCSISDKSCTFSFKSSFKNVQVGKDQEKAQSEKDPHFKKGGKTKLTIIPIP